MGKRRDWEIPVDELEVRYEQVLARWETAGRERSDMAADLLRIQTELKLAGNRPIARPDCALDQAATDVALLRRAFCSALHSHHCAKVVLEQTREAFRSAQERLDCIAVMETQRETGTRDG